VRLVTEPATPSSPQTNLSTNAEADPDGIMQLVLGDQRAGHSALDPSGVSAFARKQAGDAALVYYVFDLLQV
jgi:hypothetical protein